MNPALLAAAVRHLDEPPQQVRTPHRYRSFVAHPRDTSDDLQPCMGSISPEPQTPPPVFDLAWGWVRGGAARIRAAVFEGGDTPSTKWWLSGGHSGGNELADDRRIGPLLQLATHPGGGTARPSGAPRGRLWLPFSGVVCSVRWVKRGPIGRSCAIRGTPGGPAFRGTSEFPIEG
jgi:hypothetical protein